MKKITFRNTILAILSIISPTISLFAQDLPYDMNYFSEEKGSTYLFYVTGDDSGQCWGGEENVYTIESCLGTAAIHAGLLKANEIKLIKVKVIEARNNYPSINRNGITSESSEESESSYQLSAPEPGDIANAPTTMSDYIGKYDIEFIFRVTANKEGPVWGGKDNVYTSDSYIATAAIHAGILKDGQTGIVKLKMIPGKNSYPEITRNGIQSNSFEEWEGSYQFLKIEKK